MFLCFYQDLGYIFWIFCQTTDPQPLGQRPLNQGCIYVIKTPFRKVPWDKFSLIIGPFAQNCCLICYNSKERIFLFLFYIYIYIYVSAETILQTLHVSSMTSQFIFISWVFLLINCYYWLFGGRCLSAVACFFCV